MIPMTKQQMTKLIARACKEGLKHKRKIKVLEYQVSFRDYVMDVSFSLN